MSWLNFLLGGTILHTVLHYGEEDSNIVHIEKDQPKRNPSKREVESKEETDKFIEFMLKQKRNGE